VFSETLMHPVASLIVRTGAIGLVTPKGPEFPLKETRGNSTNTGTMAN
jgi:hypothetical protein